MADGEREIEIKLAMETSARARSLLRRAGFRVSLHRAFEANTVYDTAALALRSASCLLRVREARGEVTVTFKGPPEPGRHKSREELEAGLTSGRSFTRILERLGFCPVFRYEKYRAEYRQPGSSGLATLDETPIGLYVELEGNPDWIDRTAAKLGFPPERYITASYAGLYLEWCRQRGVKPTNMVFSDQAG